jgi:hypothetical protein
LPAELSDPASVAPENMKNKLKSHEAIADQTCGEYLRPKKTCQSKNFLRRLSPIIHLYIEKEAQ